MTPHFGSHRPLSVLLDPDLVGLPDAFATRVYLHRRGWTTRQASIASGRRHVASAERDGKRFRCEDDRAEAAWSQVLRSVLVEADDRSATLGDRG